jgi:hypothetical protein
MGIELSIVFEVYQSCFGNETASQVWKPDRQGGCPMRTVRFSFFCALRRPHGYCPDFSRRALLPARFGERFCTNKGYRPKHATIRS